MTINNQDFRADYFATDNFYKFFVLENKFDYAEAQALGYELYPMPMLKEKYDNADCLRFIDNWTRTKHYANQFEQAEFRDIPTMWEFVNNKLREQGENYGQ
jgi:mannose/fructose/N-acetylgalactosamine-specific phosphotransferase system component IID